MNVKTTSDTCKITISNRLTEINNLAGAVAKLASDWNFSSKFTGHINLAIEEVVSNIIYYAYADDKAHRITIDLVKKDTCIQIMISDDGKYFNLMESHFEIDLESSADERKVGGLGIYLTKTLVDQVDYQRIDNRNVVTLTKKY